MVFDKVKEIIGERLGVDVDSIKKDNSLTDDFSADSLDLMEIMMAIEEEFGVSIEDAALDNIATIGDLVDHIENIID